MIPAGILVSMAFPGYGWVWLIFLVIFGLIFLPTFWTRVPYYPSSEKVYALIAAELPVNQAFRFLDLGCGDAKLLSFLSEQFPLAKFEGVDLSPTAIAAAKINTHKNKNVSISFSDYWNKNFSDYDFIYAFLSPTPMEDVEHKSKAEMKKESTLLVNSFSLPNLKATKEIQIDHKNQSLLYVYKF
jgi:methylase of polypeptide subunit release factors